MTGSYPASLQKAVSSNHTSRGICGIPPPVQLESHHMLSTIASEQTMMVIKHIE
jgi:hypothetical protein